MKITPPNNPNATAVENAFVALIDYAAENGFDMTQDKNEVLLITEKTQICVEDLPEIDGFRRYICFNPHDEKMCLEVAYYKKL